MVRVSFRLNATISWCYLLNHLASAACDSSSIFTFICSNGNVSAKQEANANGCACFNDSSELRIAFRQFVFDGCYDNNNCNNTVVQTYGWPMGSWCVSNVTNMEFLFFNDIFFNDDISSWDVSSVTDMTGMFQGASSFNQDLSSWNVSAVTQMGRMFSGATSFNKDLSLWNVLAVTNMRFMFNEASSFNQDLSVWDVSSATDIERMFWGASSFNQDLCSWGMKLPVGGTTQSLFDDSGCQYRSSPSLEEGGPFCASTCGVSSASTTSCSISTLLSLFLASLLIC